MYNEFPTRNRRPNSGYEIWDFSKLYYELCKYAQLRMSVKEACDVQDFLVTKCSYYYISNNFVLNITF